MDYVVEGPFINPRWKNATDKMKKHQDRWSYRINGHSFSHPTFEGAKAMMAKPEVHAEVINYFRPDVD